MQRQDSFKMGMAMSLGLVIAYCGTVAAATPTTGPDSKAQMTTPDYNSTAKGVLSGTVRDASGEVIPGAMITVTDDDRGLGESVFSNDTGMFTLAADLVSGQLELRVRKPYFADYKQSVNFNDSGKANLDVRLRPLKTDQEISDSLPAIAHFANLPFDKEGKWSREDFQRDCLSCHQLGNAWTRIPRPPEVWMPTMERMYSYMGNTNVEDMKYRSQMMTDGFTGEPTQHRPKFDSAPELATAKIYQYRLDHSVVPHDAVVYQKTNTVYTVDQGTDDMHITSLETGETTRVKAPAAGMPQGGMFTLLNIAGGYGKTTPRGIHSLSLGHDGKFYTTDAFAGGIGVFDPETNTWEEPVDLVKALYPHTIRTGKEGNLWFTVTFSEQVGKLNPKTREVTLIDLAPAKLAAAFGGSIPYGIAVNPTDNGIWFTRLNGDQVGHVDPKTLEVILHDSPVSGPRRLRFDESGTLWLAGYAEGKIAKIDPQDFSSKVYDIPQILEGHPPGPYALGVHPDTQEIWVNETMTDQVYRFIPNEERWIAYPLPMRGSYTRDFSFTADGKACTTNSPLPLASVEGVSGEVICIKP